MRLVTRLTALLPLLIASFAHAQILSEWVESHTNNDFANIALGYPVPIPVDTPLPFDGFRTYAGLHMRHQDLAVTTPWVHPETVGATFSGRAIWAYRLGDDDRLTMEGLPEPAMLTNGGIHAREWQTPEIVTGILELLATHASDHGLYDYLRDNVNVIVVPVLNIDGFLQTQRTPTLDYLGVDPDDPQAAPRDGRMRRKNMRGADEDLYTTFDLLNGVDLNRNNEPYWARSTLQSSSNPASLVYHGSAPQSESEVRALDDAAALGPADRLRLYTDVHSFSQKHFWVRNGNSRLARQTELVLQTFSSHQAAFPAHKFYTFANRFSAPLNNGIGTTDEYFTNFYQVPSWTLETEPRNGGVDYGGVGENGHDGFILPDTQIRRVREQMAQSFAAIYYRQAGPPALQSVRVIDDATGALVFEAGWDAADDESRTLFSQQLRPLETGHSYDFWLAFNKPMRWRQNGAVVPFPGQSDNTLDVSLDLPLGGDFLTTDMGQVVWLDAPGNAPAGYMEYRDDAFRVTLSLPADEHNAGLISGTVNARLRLRTTDMTGMQTDAMPATVADWRDGAWLHYEDSSGQTSDTGGYDSSISLQVSDQPQPPPFLLEPGISSAWFDSDHDGEGFLLEMLPGNVAVIYWFTYDGAGRQDWYVGKGDVRGNRIEFSALYRVSGGEFGPGFDPEKIKRKRVGYASFVFSGCDTGSMSYHIGPQHGRMQLSRLTALMGLECGQPALPPERPEGRLSGSWFDPTHDGEGYNVEVLTNGQAVVYWFSYDPEGQRRWFFGLGEIRDGKLVFDNMKTSSGGIFGPDFDPLTVTFTPWGSLELDLDCNSGTATYSSTEPGFGSGVLNLKRLTRIDTLNCE